MNERQAEGLSHQEAGCCIKVADRNDSVLRKIAVAASDGNRLAF